MLRVRFISVNYEPFLCPPNVAPSATPKRAPGSDARLHPVVETLAFWTPWNVLDLPRPVVGLGNLRNLI